MSDISQRIANLSPEKRALFELRLMEKDTPAAKEQEIPRRGASDHFPLSFAQQRLWLLEQFEPGSSVYNIPIAVRLTGLLDVTALEKSLNEIVQRHEALRTTFSTVQEKPVQIIASTLPLKLLLTDLRELPETQREAELRRLATQEARRPFDLAKGPLLRAALLRLDEKKHVLLLTMHHIASDGWSMGVLFRELSVLYKAFFAGEPSPLPELSIQYADFAVWQRQWLQGDILEDQLSYWRERLDGAPPLLELPSDRPRPAIQAYRGARHPLILPLSLTTALKALSRQEGVTLFMLLLAGFKILLCRYTGQGDIVIGSPVANRNRVEIEELIGFFVNTLVLRTDLSGNPIFRELLGRVREVCLGAYTRQDLPFEKLVEELQPERTLSHSPLFQVMFILQNTPQSDLKLHGLTSEPIEVDSGTAKFDLTLSMVEGPEGLRGTLEYDTELFDTATIERMAGHFQTILEGIVADPGQRLSELPLLTVAERHQLLEEWNDTKTDYPRDKCIHHLFEKQVERAPDATALVCEDQQITYRELNRRANQLAHFLQAQGVGPEVLVGICLERSIEMIVGLLGILKAGGAYVPLDPTYPQERLAYMVSDARMPIIVLQERFIKLFPDLKSKIVVLDRDRGALVNEPQDNIQSGVKVEHLSYVIYTSGSTGKPKGVMIEHRNVVNLFTGIDACIEPDSKGTWLAVTSLSFDISVIEIFWTLARGLRVVIYSGNDTRSIPDLMQLHNVTHFQCTPSMAGMLMMDTEAKHALKRLQKFVIGGEAFPVSLAEQLQKVIAGDVINGYGPTETTVYSSLYILILNNYQHSIPIGRPVANTKIYILDEHLQPVPVGVLGELMIGGAGVVRGYLNRPELTSERFIANPFYDDPAMRIYRTGDLCRYLPDGNIEFIGRIDHQVKIRGYRIELGEIEMVLSEHPGVKMTVAVVREDQPGDKRLVAYVVPKEVEAPGVRNLRDYLKEKLPEYMVPGAFVILESLPLTPNKKVDRLRLPAPDRIRSEPEKTYVAPRTPVEVKLAEIWARVLGLDQVGVNDNFFELGGHSLLAVRLFAYIEQIIGQRLPLATLFKAPTIERLARIIRDDGWQASQSSLVPIKTTGSRFPFYCVHGAGGAVFELYPLARHLSPDQPFFGLQDPRIEGGSIDELTIEGMASHYIQELRSVQPQGPYIVGGYCFGAIVAYEMVQQLQAYGEEVTALIIIEGYYRGGKEQGSAPEPSRVRRLINYFINRICLERRNLSVRETKEKLPYIRSRARRAIEKSRVKIQIAIDPFLTGFNFRSKHSLPYKVEALYKLHIKAQRNYEAIPYNGRVIIFKGIEKSFGISSGPYLGWDRLINGELEVCEVPGLHENIIFEPWVKVLAEKLSDSLKRLNHGR